MHRWATPATTAAIVGTLVRYSVFALALTACGRDGYEVPLRAPVDNVTDGGDPGSLTPSKFNPKASACTSAENGPFVEVTRYETSSVGYGVWVVPPYILYANTADGLHSLRFDGTTISAVDHKTSSDWTGLGWVEDIWADTTQLYASSPGYGLTSFTLGDDGSLTQGTSLVTGYTEARRLWGKDTTLFVPAGPQGLTTVSLVGGVLTASTAKLASNGWGEGAAVFGNTIAFADQNQLRLVRFNGTDLLEFETHTEHTGFNRVWWNKTGDVLFAANNAGVQAYGFDGDHATALGLAQTGVASRDVWSDGVNVFVAGGTSGLYAFAFDGVGFTQIDHIATNAEALGVIGDGTYLYSTQGPLVVYSGFRCLTFDP